MNELKFEYSPAQLRSVIEKIENDPFSNFLRAKLHRFFRWLLNRRNSFKIIGQDNLRSVKNFVLVSNHSSHLDVICLLSTLPLEKLNGCYSVAAEDYFFSNDIFAYLSRIFANTLPISRSFGAYAGLKACATLLDQGKSPRDAGNEIARAKLYACDIASRIALRAIQVMGGYGAIAEYEVVRRLNDALELFAAAGTQEIMKNTICRSIIT